MNNVRKCRLVSLDPFTKTSLSYFFRHRDGSDFSDTVITRRPEWYNPRFNMLTYVHDKQNIAEDYKSVVSHLHIIH